MSDPYRPENYYISQGPYGSPDGYNQNTTQQHQIQLSQSRSSPHEQPYYHSGGLRSDQYQHRHHSRSRSRRGSSTRRRGDGDEADMSDNGSDKSPRRHNGGSGGAKNALGVVAGAGAGGFLGHEILGGGVVGTVSGMLVGAIGAQALERRHERHKKTRRASFGDGERRSNGERKEGLMDKIGGFLAVPGHGDEAKKRSRSHTDESGRRRSKRDDSDGSETEDERGRWRRY